MLKNQTCCCIGPTFVQANAQMNLNMWMDSKITRLYQDYHIRYFGIGGNRGFELAVANTILLKRARLLDCKIILVAPCPEFADRWRDKDKSLYVKVKGSANKVVSVSPYYIPDCMRLRNKHLIDKSSVLICMEDKPGTETSLAIQYARESGLEVFCFRGSHSPNSFS